MAVGGGHPWPYGIIALRVGTANTLLGPALPKLERFQRGFNLFRANCIMCHSVNGVGGTIGIDLNVPRNVFEYWQADKLPSMVANPASFRRNAKMPSFEALGPQGISNVLAYVKHMKAHKIQPPP
jgi:mono/diheme cytochrome c family protein